MSDMQPHKIGSGSARGELQPSRSSFSCIPGNKAGSSASSVNGDNDGRLRPVSFPSLRLWHPSDPILLQINQSRPFLELATPLIGTCMHAFRVSGFNDVWDPREQQNIVQTEWRPADSTTSSMSSRRTARGCGRTRDRTTDRRVGVTDRGALLS